MSENRNVTVPIGGALGAPADADIGVMMAPADPAPGVAPKRAWVNSHCLTGCGACRKRPRCADDSRMPALSEHAVVIVGAGPTGMMLGAELTLAGVDVAIVERRATSELEGSRAGAGGLHSRTLEVLDQRGVVDRFLADGQTSPRVGYAYISLDISDFPTRHNYLLALWQKDTERILAAWIEELGVSVLRGTEVTGIAEDTEGVDVRLSDGRSLLCEYVIGCDGGRSIVRRSAGIDFVGWDASSSFLIAQAEMRSEER